VTSVQNPNLTVCWISTTAYHPTKRYTPKK